MQVETLAVSQPVGVGGDRLGEVESGEAGAAGMVLLGGRSAEEGRDPVAGELVDSAAESAHALGENLKEAVHDRRPVLGVQRLGEVHRTFHVGEEHGHLFTLSPQGGLGLRRRRRLSGLRSPRRGLEDERLAAHGAEAVADLRGVSTPRTCRRQ
ncbi:MAG: hypothetical protein QOJ23_4236 [Actinomycetota bacterium]|nr:hypothetical protein [Actinomycetota bacterium]MDQ1497912.1 hypothetical protein [Actinomycetota bacterium]